MPRLAPLLILLAILGLGCAWLLWPATEPVPEDLRPQAGEAPADAVAEAVSPERRTPLAPEPPQASSDSEASNARASVEFDALGHELDALKGQVRGTVFYSADEGNHARHTYPPLPFATIEIGFWPG
ncbi:MAG: hypothetical protein ACYTFV_14285 [Planctomycetota bacterium]|jgi:hypothetical protein